MDIGALSMNLSQMRLSQEVGAAVMKMSMDTANINASDLIKLLESSTKAMQQSINPHIGGNIDVSL